MFLFPNLEQKASLHQARPSSIGEERAQEGPCRRHKTSAENARRPFLCILLSPYSSLVTPLTLPLLAHVRRVLLGEVKT